MVLMCLLFASRSDD
ncbi:MULTISPECIES: hypothetical protein [Variovorax]